MKIHFIIVKTTNDKSETTKQSIEGAKLNSHKIEYSIGEVVADSRKQEAIALNTYIKSSLIKYDYICIIPSPSTVNEHIGQFIEDYIINNTEIVEQGKEMYLPLVELLQEDNKEFIPKGFLNTCVWKSYMQPEEVGFLDKTLANKQIDTTLYGCLIPQDIFEKINFDETFEYFYQFNAINKIVAQEITIVGIPKSFVALVHDYELKGEDETLKKEEFKKAKEI